MLDPSKCVSRREIGGLDNQRVAVPVAARVPHPLAYLLWQMWAPVHGDDASVVDHLIENHHRVRSLKELHIVVVRARVHRRAGVEPHDAVLR